MNDTELNGPWRFRLKRAVTGFKSKTVVADGAQFADGTCVLRWRSSHASTAVYANHAELIEIHGHEGETECVWIDTPPTKEFKEGALHCAMDGNENAPFASIGGLEARANPVPRFAKPGLESEYLRGYIACARANYGEDWATCEFGWSAAITIGEPDA